MLKKMNLAGLEDQGTEMHCQRGNSSLLHQIAFDWLDEILAG